MCQIKKKNCFVITYHFYHVVMNKNPNNSLKQGEMVMAGDNR